MKRLALVLAVVASATIYAQSPMFSRGENVRLKASDPDRLPSTAMVLTVVAVPNDSLAVSDGSLVVNGTRVAQFSSEFLDRVVSNPARIPARVPEGHYFVMGEQRINQNVSEYWGQHAASSLETAR